MTIQGSTWARQVSTVLGAGYSPLAPGTAGSLAALPFAVLLAYTPLAVQILVIAAVSVVGTVAADQVARRSGVKDPQQIVVDEFAGMLLTLVGVPLHWWLFLIGFVLFRLLDIVKPYPIGWLDRHVEGGLGIMLDDLAAGGIARVILLLVSVVVL
ncbi:MAG: phosphatidylglycerophosphatase A [Bradymonadales bacterium]|nr:phosphatidylglycerophosphatase A [Bradymonadales bacterium]